MQLDFSARELAIKLVYYGPALSGKTTNLQAIHRLAGDSCGRLMTLETKDDRTLFFDLLPLDFAAGRDLRIRIKLFTVPGQVMHDATRRIVLQGADGLAFIADSQIHETRANQASFLNMRENLQHHGVDPNDIPLVLQFNKRDLPSIRSNEEIDALAAKGKEPVYRAIATRGQGVIETFLGLLDLTWRQLEREHGLEEKFRVRREEVLQDARRRLEPAA